MKWVLFYVVGLLFLMNWTNPPIPKYMAGSFMDDYGIKYAVSNTEWIQFPDFKLNIIMVDTAEQFLIGFNSLDSTYTKVDYMPFGNQGDFKWGFCYSAYDKKLLEEALQTDSPNRNTPKTGCNGFPFSRMKAAGKD